MVVEKFIFQLEAQLADRGVMIELSEEASKWIAEKGYDEKFGARPLARVIQEYIKKPLADELLFGKLEHGGTVKVVVAGKGEDRALAFEYFPADPTKRPKAKSEDDDDEDDVGRAAGGPRRCNPAQGASGSQGQEGARSEDHGLGADGAAPQAGLIAVCLCKLRAPGPKARRFCFDQAISSGVLPT